MAHLFLKLWLKTRFLSDIIDSSAVCRFVWVEIMRRHNTIPILINPYSKKNTQAKNTNVWSVVSCTMKRKQAWHLMTYPTIGLAPCVQRINLTLTKYKTT